MGSNITYLNAGTITITGGAISPIKLTPTTTMLGTTYPDGLKGTETLFATGTTLCFGCTGGATIPAFSGQVIAPAPVTITQPANFDSMTNIASSVSWTPSNATRVELTVGKYDAAQAGTTIITCEAKDADGAVTIPPELTAKLPSSSTEAITLVTRSNVQSLTVGSKTVTLSVSTIRERTYP
jgi:hypothetical protein